MESFLGNSRRPDVSFYANGRIDITSRVVHLLGIADGDVIDVGAQGGEYFLYVRTKANGTGARHEAQCWPTKKGSHNFRAYSKRLCRSVMRLSNAQVAARLPVGSTTRIYDGTTKALILIARHNLGETTKEQTYDY